MNEQLKIVVKNNFFENTSTIFRLFFGIISTISCTVIISVLIFECFKGNCILELILFFIFFLILSSIFLLVGIWENFGITTIFFEKNIFHIELNYRVFKSYKTYNPFFMSELSHNIPEVNFFELFRGMDSDKLKFFYYSNLISFMPSINSKEANTIIFEVNKLINQIKNN